MSAPDMKRDNVMKRLAVYLLSLALIAPGLSSAQSGVTANTVLLGQSVALTGPAAALGIEMRTGAKVYFDYVNSRGGIHGRKIELRTLDDGYEPSRTAPNTKKLIEEDGVFVLFGYVGTPTAAAALPIFTQARVPFFGAFTGAELLRDPFNAYIFNVRASYYDETERIVEQLVSQRQSVVGHGKLFIGHPARHLVKSFEMGMHVAGALDDRMQAVEDRAPHQLRQIGRAH